MPCGSLPRHWIGCIGSGRITVGLERYITFGPLAVEVASVELILTDGRTIRAHVVEKPRGLRLNFYWATRPCPLEPVTVRTHADEGVRMCTAVGERCGWRSHATPKGECSSAECRPGTETRPRIRTTRSAIAATGALTPPALHARSTALWLRSRELAKPGEMRPGTASPSHVCEVDTLSEVHEASTGLSPRVSMSHFLSRGSGAWSDLK
jgi:hypothetical protein